MPSNPEGYMKKYYQDNQDNKEKIIKNISEKNKQIVLCEICKRNVQKGSLAHHNRTQIHSAHIKAATHP